MWRPGRVGSLSRCVFLVVVSLGAAMYVRAPAELAGFQGEDITLKCTFRSDYSDTHRLSANWAFRPKTGGPLESVFHYQSAPYPATEGRFKDRVSWAGDISWRDVSILIRNLSLSDNGTFTCAVKNPPDVHGPLAQTELSVTRRPPSLRFTGFAVLVLLVLLPSALILLVLLGRVCCRCSSTETHSGDYKKSPIEVLEGEEIPHQRATAKHKSCAVCCATCLEDLDHEEYYIPVQQQLEEPVAESHC
ncbi:myelin protein zero-like protein 3 isoform X2 [Amia ocellicauda]|uniref:myelin protein zero-like protein 3 isoform X2 n=1 Tax=Amia ocellicauda TaxID=2972642 RepID=UPI0034644FEC